jgi:uncharacterized protein (TIGR03067 family)
MLYALTVVAAGLLAGPDDAKKADPLNGTWVVVSMTHGGEENAKAKDSTVTFADGKIMIKDKAEGKDHSGTYTLDTTKKPPTIDMVPADGPEKGMTMKGVYSLEKGELKICMAQAGKDRPTALSSKAGDDTMMIVLKKADKK